MDAVQADPFLPPRPVVGLGGDREVIRGLHPGDAIGCGVRTVGSPTRTARVERHLSVVAMGAVLWLLWSNLDKIGGSIIWVDIIPWLCLGWLVVGVGLALVLRKRNPEKYEVLGRMVNAGIE